MRLLATVMSLLSLTSLSYLSCLSSNSVCNRRNADDIVLVIPSHCQHGVTDASNRLGVVLF